MTVLALVQFSIATPICLFVASVIYNLFFHPLRHYPGPWLSAATKIPWYRALLTGDLSFYTQRIHEKYGDIVRISPNELSYITAGAWKDVYANRVNHVLLPKDEKFYHPPPGGAHSILTAPHEAHSRIRRLLSHAFSEKALRDQESLIKIYVDLLIQRLHEESNSKPASLDMVSWYNWTTFDIFGDLMFAEPFGCLDSASYHPWVDLLFKSIKAQTLANAAAHLGILPLLRRFPPKRLVETRLKHMSMTTEKVTKRLDLKTDRADFMGFILKHNDDEFAMSLPEIKSTSFGIIIAGSETTATLLSGTTYYLLKNPEKLAKLTKEVREAFHSEDEINLTSVNGLTYMLAVLDEGLRMYPPVPVGLPRRVPESGETIVGKFVPPNTVVSVNHWASYRSPRNFSQPESFIPERWLDDTDFSDNKRVFQPFSTGPRACIGRNLAYVEMKLILARIVWNFDMEIDATSNDWANQKMFILWDKPPLLVRMTSRPDLQTLKSRSKNSEKV